MFAAETALAPMLDATEMATLAPFAAIAKMRKGMLAVDIDRVIGLAELVLDAHEQTAGAGSSSPSQPPSPVQNRSGTNMSVGTGWRA